MVKYVTMWDSVLSLALRPSSESDGLGNAKKGTVSELGKGKISCYMAGELDIVVWMVGVEGFFAPKL